MIFKGAGDAGDATNYREKVNLKWSSGLFSGEEDRFHSGADFLLKIHCLHLVF